MSRDSAVSGLGKSSIRSVMRQQIPALPYLQTNTPAEAFCCGCMDNRIRDLRDVSLGGYHV
jgi:hypothetical protein